MASASGTITSDEMTVVDENCEWMGLKRVVLMENAGRAVAEAVLNVLKDVGGRKVLVLCGPGNNGGDGLAAARHLTGMGAETKVLILADPSKIKTDESRRNFETVRNMKLSIKLDSVDSTEELLQHVEAFSQADVIVDAILGTGARGGLSGVLKTAVDLANSSKAFKLSVDIPTGLDPDTGEGEVFFQPDLVVALHMPKPVHRRIQEKTVVERIGIPAEAGVVAGPGQLKLLVRKAGRDKLYTGRIAYIFGEKGPDERVREFLTSLKGFTAFCNLDMLVENPELRYAVAASRSVLLAGDINPSSVKPFLPRSQPVVVSNLATAGLNPVYVLFSEKPLAGELRQVYQTLLKDVEELCRKLAAPIYVVGEVDSMTNGSKTYLNWMGRPLTQAYHAYAQALVAWFVGAGADPLLSTASASYLLRSAEPAALEMPQKLAAYVSSSIEQYS
ncbi:MAG: NAD(P)H-hydrate epimerase [Candidatus Caldarchaeum sp.]